MMMKALAPDQGAVRIDHVANDALHRALIVPVHRLMVTHKPKPQAPGVKLIVDHSEFLSVAGRANAPDTQKTIRQYGAFAMMACEKIFQRSAKRRMTF